MQPQHPCYHIGHETENLSTLGGDRARILSSLGEKEVRPRLKRMRAPGGDPGEEAARVPRGSTRKGLEGVLELIVGEGGGGESWFQEDQGAG